MFHYPRRMTMDSTLLILMKLFLGGPQTFKEILGGLQQELAEECPYGENELGLDLHALADGSDYVAYEAGKYILTNSGINLLKTNKKVRFIYKTMHWMDQLQAAGRV